MWLSIPQSLTSRGLARGWIVLLEPAKVRLTPSKSCNDLSGTNRVLISQSYRMAGLMLS